VIGARTIQVPRFLDIAPGALATLPAQLADAFDIRRVVIATGSETTSRLAAQLEGALAELGADIHVISGLKGLLTDANDLLAILDVQRPTLVVAVGGGRPLDAAKLAAGRAKVELVTVPTSLSNDGMASPVASLVFPDDVRRSIGAGMPTGVVIDLEIVRAAPDRNLRAGIGDLVSNLTAVLDWRLAQLHRGERFDELAASLALQSAVPALSIDWPVTDEDLEAIARGLVMSGLAMEIAGTSRPCSGAEHLISHSLDQLLGPRALLHGEQVALGCLIATALHQAHVEPVRALFARCGLPRRAEDWPFDLDLLVDAVCRAPATRPERHTILDDIDLTTDAVRSLVIGALDVDACATQP
jgi:glycerol-1-phosphate dehydrogenase [NAD(P)+]